MATELRTLIEALSESETHFVIIGGVALVIHGSARTTQDLDLCYARQPENLAALENALRRFHPTLRGAPKDLPFRLDAATLKAGLNFTLETDVGDVDLLGEVPGVGTYADVARDAIEVEVYGRKILVMSLEALERAKRAAGRRRDLLDLAEIHEIRKRQPK